VQKFQFYFQKLMDLLPGNNAEFIWSLIFLECSLDLTVNWEFILWRFNATNMLVYVCHTLVPHSTILSNFSLV